MGKKKDDINAGCMGFILIMAMAAGISGGSWSAFFMVLIVGFILGGLTRTLR